MEKQEKVSSKFIFVKEKNLFVGKTVLMGVVALTEDRRFTRGRTFTINFCLPKIWEFKKGLKTFHYWGGIDLIEDIC